MRERLATRWQGIIGVVAITLALVGSLSACSGPKSAAPGHPSAVESVTCDNYVLAGKPHEDEVSVHVVVQNATARREGLAVTVRMTESQTGAAPAPATEVTVVGSVAANSVADLGHKVLTASPVKHCEVGEVTQS